MKVGRRQPHWEFMSSGGRKVGKRYHTAKGRNPKDFSHKPQGLCSCQQVREGGREWVWVGWKGQKVGKWDGGSGAGVE